MALCICKEKHCEHHGPGEPCRNDADATATDSFEPGMRGMIANRKMGLCVECTENRIKYDEDYPVALD
jgi:hypothetical protein